MIWTIAALIVAAFAWATWHKAYAHVPFDTDHGVYLWPLSRRSAPYVGHFDVKPPGIYYAIRMGALLGGRAWALTPGGYHAIVAVFGIAASSIAGIALGGETWRSPVYALVVALLLMLPAFGAILANTEVFAIAPLAGAVYAASHGHPFITGVLIGATGITNIQTAVSGFVGCVLLLVSSVAESRNLVLLLSVGMLLCPMLAVYAMNRAGTLRKFAREFVVFWRYADRGAVAGETHGAYFGPPAFALACLAAACTSLPLLAAAMVAVAMPLRMKLLQPYHALPAALLLLMGADPARLAVAVLAGGAVALWCWRWSFGRRGWQSPHDAVFAPAGLKGYLAICDNIRQAAASTITSQNIHADEVALVVFGNAAHLALDYPATPFVTPWPETPHLMFGNTYEPGDVTKRCLADGKAVIAVWPDSRQLRYFAPTAGNS